MAVFSEVAGSGPPVVLIHAGVCDSRMWDPQWDVLTREHRVMRLDLRGFGRSALEPGDLCNAEDVLAAMDRFDIERAAVVGASMGGAVATQIALASPERVGALVLIDPAIDDHAWSAEMRSAWAREEELLDDGQLDAAADWNVRFWVDGPGRPEGAAPADVRALVAQMQRRAFELQAPVADDVEDRELAQRLGARAAEIAVPALVIDGEHDVGDFREIASRMAGSISGARQVTIAGAAHLPSVEQPEAVEDVLVPFLLDHAT